MAEPDHELRRRPGPAIGRLRHPRRPIPGRRPGDRSCSARSPATSTARSRPARLGDDHGNDPAHAISACAVFLGDAAASAAALAGDLDAAWQQLAPINGRPGRPGRKDTT